MQHVHRHERRCALERRALRLHQQPQLRGAPGSRWAHTPGQSTDGRGGSHRRAFCRYTNRRLNPSAALHSGSVDAWWAAASVATRHQPKNKPINIRRGESGGEWKGGPLWSPAYLFIWLESYGNTTTPAPRATIKALTTPHHPPSPLQYIDMHACLEVYWSCSKITVLSVCSPVLQANSRTNAPRLCTCRGDAYDDGCTFRTLISFHSPWSLLL